MRRIPGRAGILAACAAIVLLAPAARTAGAPKIEPQADAHLKQMCSFLAGLKAFSVTIEETVDDLRASGQVVEQSNRRRLTVRRPDRLTAEMTGDAGSRQLFYDGKTVTIFDRKANAYASVEAPPTIEAMMDDMFQRVGANPPLADFLFPDSYKVLTEHAQSGTLVGTHRVGDTGCFHLAFREAALDWQVWIDAGDKPLPRRVAILFKEAAGAPAGGWNTNVASETWGARSHSFRLAA